MENFAVDLDKMLDDLEEDEDVAKPGTQPTAVLQPEHTPTSDPRTFQEPSEQLKTAETSTNHVADGGNAENRFHNIPNNMDQLNPVNDLHLYQTYQEQSLTVNHAENTSTHHIAYNSTELASNVSNVTNVTELSYEGGNDTNLGDEFAFSTTGEHFANILPAVNAERERSVDSSVTNLNSQLKTMETSQGVERGSGGLDSGDRLEDCEHQGYGMEQGQASVVAENVEDLAQSEISHETASDMLSSGGNSNIRSDESGVTHTEAEQIQRYSGAVRETTPTHVAMGDDPRSTAQAGHAVPGSSSVMHEAEQQRSFHMAIYKEHPELLEAATQLQAHLAGTSERPSFLSSSPPLSTYQHPDLIPAMRRYSSESSGVNSDSEVVTAQGNQAPMEDSGEAFSLPQAWQQRTDVAFTLRSSPQHIPDVASGVNEHNNQAHAVPDVAMPDIAMPSANSTMSQQPVWDALGIPDIANTSNQATPNRRLDLDIVASSIADTSCELNQHHPDQLSMRSEDEHSLQMLNPAGEFSEQAAATSNVAITSDSRELNLIGQNLQNPASFPATEDESDRHVAGTTHAPPHNINPGGDGASAMDVDLPDNLREALGLTNRQQGGRARESPPSSVRFRMDDGYSIALQTRPMEPCINEVTMLAELIVDVKSLERQAASDLDREFPQELRQPADTVVSQAQGGAGANEAPVEGQEAAFSTINQEAVTCMETQETHEESSISSSERYNQNPVTAMESQGITYPEAVPHMVLNTRNPSNDNQTTSTEPGMLGSRRLSGDSVERFLVPYPLSPPSLPTPREDPGITKLPGYQPEIRVTPEETHVAEKSGMSQEITRPPGSLTWPSGSLAMPSGAFDPQQEISRGKPSRPSSLLGLSRPKLPNPTEESALESPFSKLSSLEIKSPADAVAASSKTSELGSVEPSTRGKRPLGVTDNAAPEATTPDKVQRPMSWPDAMPPETLPSLDTMKRPGNLEIKSLGEAPTQRPTSLTEEAPDMLMPGQVSIPMPAEHVPEDLVSGLDRAAEHGAEIPSESILTFGAPAAPSNPSPTTSMPPTCSALPSMLLVELGRRAPVWLPDMNAAECMQCELKFTFTKRRHHCRACGLIYCASCCTFRARLEYLDSKEARVCSKCYQDLIRAQSIASRFQDPLFSDTAPAAETHGSLQAPAGSGSGPVGVLRSDSSRRERKEVMFSDGVRPGGDLAELDGSDTAPSTRQVHSSRKKAAKASKVAHRKEPDSLVSGDGPPPVFRGYNESGELLLSTSEDMEQLVKQMKDVAAEPVQFVVNKNLFVLVKLVNLDCCVGRLCWGMCSQGLVTVGQEEVLMVLEYSTQDGSVPPSQVFTHLHNLYLKALQGERVSHLDHSLLPESPPFLGCKENCGILYVHPSFHCLQRLPVPATPWVFGLVLQRWEVPWAKTFPLRLMLRLGAEYRYYPCPLVNVRDRGPVYGEIGHTVMSLLSDLHTFKYTLPRVRGLTVQMEDQQITVNIPHNRYNEVMRALQTDTEQVLALAASFSLTAESYLVCTQDDQGYYKTQAINIQNRPRAITGATFIVFNGSLKTGGVSSREGSPQHGHVAKSNLQEDGVMVHIRPETLAALRQALTAMQDFTLVCCEDKNSLPTVGEGGQVVQERDEEREGSTSRSEESIVLRWVEDDRSINSGVLSPIDSLPLAGVDSVTITTFPDYLGEHHHALRWTKVYFLKMSQELGDPTGPPSASGVSGRGRGSEVVDLSRLAEHLAKATGKALRTRVHMLFNTGVTCLGLRATIDRENVGYEVGANNEALPDWCTKELDSELIPVIHSAAASCQHEPVILELTFYIINY